MSQTSFREAAVSLAPAVPAEGGSKTKCAVRLLDTVFVGPGSGNLGTRLSGGAWLYTSKNGTIALKKRDQLKASKVAERFVRFAMVNPLNKERFVATLHRTDGLLEELREPELQRVLEAAESPDATGKSEVGAGLTLDQVEALQVYLRPRNGAAELFVCEYRRGPGSSGTSVRLLRRSRSFAKDGQGGAPYEDERELPETWEPSARAEVLAASDNIVRHIQVGAVVEHALSPRACAQPSLTPLARPSSSSTHRLPPSPGYLR